MRCECCTRKLGRSEVVHSIRYGGVDETDAFIPDRDSAATVLCNLCGNKIMTFIYQKFNKFTLPIN